MIATLVLILLKLPAIGFALVNTPLFIHGFLVANLFHSGLFLNKEPFGRHTLVSWGSMSNHFGEGSLLKFMACVQAIPLPLEEFAQISSCTFRLLFKEPSHKIGQTGTTYIGEILYFLGCQVEFFTSRSI